MDGVRVNLCADERASYRESNMQVKTLDALQMKTGPLVHKLPDHFNWNISASISINYKQISNLLIDRNHLEFLLSPINQEDSRPSRSLQALLMNMREGLAVC